MTSEEFKKFFNMRLSDLKESAENNEYDYAMKSYYRGKCVGTILLAFELGIIDNTDYMRLSEKIFSA